MNAHVGYYRSRLPADVLVAPIAGKIKDPFEQKDYPVKSTFQVPDSPEPDLVFDPDDPTYKNDLRHLYATVFCADGRKAPQYDYEYDDDA